MNGAENYDMVATLKKLDEIDQRRAAQRRATRARLRAKVVELRVESPDDEFLIDMLRAIDLADMGAKS